VYVNGELAAVVMATGQVVVSVGSVQEPTQVALGAVLAMELVLPVKSTAAVLGSEFVRW